VVGYPAVATLPGYEHCDIGTVVGLLEDCGAFMMKGVAPTN